ncbi:unnamed protein product [Cuscuta campestris]|uniref:RNase H type-1 domain-containing protein n=1 Tax=Cuscuta campestris TaxID=132261 RepID=A0A484N556_9ASTE|nr:unnamed protein product [Cuscuta campestris]
MLMRDLDAGMLRNAHIRRRLGASSTESNAASSSAPSTSGASSQVSSRRATRCRPTSQAARATTQADPTPEWARRILEQQDTIMQRMSEIGQQDGDNPPVYGEQPVRSKLFSDLFKQSPKTSSQANKSMFKGCPSITFSQEDVDGLTTRFRYALIVKFRRRPPLLVVKNFLTRLGFSGGFTVGELFSNSFLINFEQDEDYQRFFYRKVWTIGKDTMSVTKWSPTLTQEEDSPIVLVWISIPHLPIHLHEQAALFSIASMLGTPLKVDNATLNFTIPKYARVCVELDISRTLHQRILVKHADVDLFSQVVYEDPPLFCNSCRKLGHNHLTCKPVTQPAKRDIPAPKVQDNNDDKVQQGWSKVTRKGKAPAIPRQGDISKPVHVWAPKPTIREEHVETSKTGARRRAPVFLPSTNVFFLGPFWVSGHTINSSKSSIMVGKKFNTMRIRELEQLLTMPHRKLPFSYVGSPIHSGITRKHHCTLLISSFDKKLNGWYQKNLDQAGRLILINHVLNIIPNYFLAANTVPKSIINLLHQKMARFWWGCGQKKHHWLKWESLSLPKEEGGIGTRDIQSLEEAFSLKLWWKYPHNNSLWGRFMRAKYHRRGEMECHLVDSPTWTRITRINVKSLNHCHTTEEEAFIWNEDPSGQFTLKSAYEVCKTNSSPSLGFHNIWESPQKSKISIFMWKLLRKCLPIPENLQKLGFALPYVCPFCMNSSLIAKHSLIDCAKIVDIRGHYARCLNFLHTESSTINQHFMNWWLRDTPNLYGLLRKHLPGIITWHIWKKMNEIIYGKCSNFSTSSLIHQIDSYTKQRLSIKTPRKLHHFDSWLFSHNLIPRFTSHNYVRMVKWKAPPTGRLKLNVDASYTTTHQRGAAILRDAEGRLVRGASFKLHSRSAYQAEVDAANKAIRWALLISNSLIYETDAKSIISRIPLFNKNSVSSFPIDVLGQLILQNGIQVSHILREGNSAADGLAKVDRTLDSPLKEYWHINLCPDVVKNILYHDCIPLFRFH